MSTHKRGSSKYASRRVVLAVAGWLVVSGWGCKAPQKGSLPQRTHPTVENVIPETAVTSVLTREASAPTPEMQKLATQLRALARETTIGSADGDRLTSFGRIVDAVVGGSGSLIVLDRTMASAKAFDAHGQFTAELPSPSGDPFRSVEAIDELPDGRVLVLDKSSTFPIKLFALSKGRYQISRQIPIDVWPEDVCVGADTMYVMGLPREGPHTADKAIHAYTLEGSRVTSFEDAYKSEVDIVRKQMSQSVLGCDKESATLVSALKRQPYVSGYSPDGKRLWRTRVADFRTPTIEEGPNGFHISTREVFDLPTAVIPLGRSHVLLQIARVGRREGSVEMHSYLLRTSDGRGLYAGTQIPLLLTAKGPRLFALERKPYERVVEYRVAQ